MNRKLFTFRGSTSSGPLPILSFKHNANAWALCSTNARFCCIFTLIEAMQSSDGGVGTGAGVGSGVTVSLLAAASLRMVFDGTESDARIFWHCKSSESASWKHFMTNSQAWTVSFWKMGIFADLSQNSQKFWNFHFCIFCKKSYPSIRISRIKTQKNHYGQIPQHGDQTDQKNILRKRIPTALRSLQSSKYRPRCQNR